jgi:hypothetical protein
VESRFYPENTHDLDRHPELVDDKKVLDALAEAVHASRDPVSTHDVVKVLFNV